ncbi:hypothetical protein BGZ61DRAFT_211444 [Ilyonectria robusta]|uniref:uncharacterized protein n=1 Tax=Ilyonectria robusta TaxID=1079257 RepID=UPI001E8D356C|nr:uncharacterized protein BGZ61DRAFT_211444 [Ilyonectria robusta]KAH8714421.1 hypothetical protein BGZ61DRAFT_211444 [Ilyonectria robusta]
MGFSILGGGFSVKTIVPETSELMMASQRGDVSAVRALFVSQRASPYDVTPSNCGPLRVSNEGVQEWPIGHRRTQTYMMTVCYRERFLGVGTIFVPQWS